MPDAIARREPDKAREAMKVVIEGGIAGADRSNRRYVTISYIGAPANLYRVRR